MVPGSLPPCPGSTTITFPNSGILLIAFTLESANIKMNIIIKDPLNIIFFTSTFT